MVRIGSRQLKGVWRCDSVPTLPYTPGVRLCARNIAANAPPRRAATVRAQDVPTLSTNVNLVTVLATVHDHGGRIVNNLGSDDFVLQEDGIPQKIRYFSRESDLPLTVGILVDTSRSQRGVLRQESMASSTFLDQVLREGKDQAFVGRFDTQFEILQALTSSRSQLASALDQLTIPEEVATFLYSAVRESSDNVMGKQSGGRRLFC